MKDPKNGFLDQQQLARVPELVYVASMMGAWLQLGLLGKAADQAKQLTAAGASSIMLQAHLSRFSKMLEDPTFKTEFTEFMQLLTRLPRNEAVGAFVLAQGVHSGLLPGIHSEEVKNYVRLVQGAMLKKGDGGNSVVLKPN